VVEQNEALPELWDRADVKDKGGRISRYLGGEQGWLELGIHDRGASRTGPDFRSLCLVREAISFNAIIAMIALIVDERAGAPCARRPRRRPLGRADDSLILSILRLWNPNVREKA
jgi:acyl-CoA dehydrogenase